MEQNELLLAQDCLRLVEAVGTEAPPGIFKHPAFLSLKEKTCAKLQRIYDEEGDSDRLRSKLKYHLVTQAIQHLQGVDSKAAEIAKVLNLRREEVNRLQVNVKAQDRRVIENLHAMHQLISSQLNQHANHFIQELIQNADDCTYEEEAKIQFLILHCHPQPDWMWILTNEKGFSWPNVKAISDCGLSSKKGTKRTQGALIGEKGIGFKSVFRACSKVAIQSNGYCFGFSRSDHSNPMAAMIPVWIPPLCDDPLRKGTTVAMKLQQGDHCYEKEFDVYALLFLRKLREVSFEYQSQGQSQKIVCFKRQGDDDVQLTCSRFDAKEKIPHAMRSWSFHLVHQLVEMDGIKEPRRDGATDRTLTLAFPYEKGEAVRLSATGHNKTSVYAHLPVLNGNGFEFLINADFVLIANREDLQTDSPWNKRLRDHVADAFLKAFDELFSRVSGFRISFLNYLMQFPTSGFFCGIRASIFAGLKQKRCIRTFDGSWELPEKCLNWNTKRGAAKIFPPDVVMKCTGRHFISEGYEAHTHLLGELAVGVFTVDHIAHLLASEEFSQVLLREPKRILALFDYLPESTIAVHKVRPCKIFKSREAMHDATHALFLPMPGDYSFLSEINFLSEDTVDTKSLGYGWLVRTGLVYQPTPINILRLAILPILTDTGTRHAVDCGRYIVDHMQELRLSCNELYTAAWILDSSNRLLPPKSLYLPSCYGRTTAKPLENLVTGAFVSDTYLKRDSETKRWRDCFLAVGVTEIPRPDDLEKLFRNPKRHRSLLMFIDEHWDTHYVTQYRHVLPRLRELQVKCKNGRRAVMDTYDPYADELQKHFGDDLPYLPITLGKGLQGALGLRRLVNVEAILSHLSYVRQVHGAARDHQFYTRVYRLLGARVCRSDRAVVRRCFQETSLIFVGVDDPQKGNFFKPDEVVWSAPKVLQPSMGSASSPLILSAHYGEELRELFRDYVGVAPYLPIEKCFSLLKSVSAQKFDLASLEKIYLALLDYSREMPETGNAIKKFVDEGRLLIVGHQAFFSSSEVWLDHPSCLDGLLPSNRAVRRAFDQRQLDAGLESFFMHVLQIPSTPPAEALLAIITGEEANKEQRSRVYHMLRATLTTRDRNNSLLAQIRKVPPLPVGAPVSQLWWEQPAHLNDLLGTDRVLGLVYPAELKDFFCHTLGAQLVVPTAILLDALEMPLLVEKAALLYKELRLRHADLNIIRHAFYGRRLIHAAGQKRFTTLEAWWEHNKALSRVLDGGRMVKNAYGRDSDLKEFFVHHLLLRSGPSHEDLTAYISALVDKGQQVGEEERSNILAIYQALDEMAGKFMLPTSLASKRILLTCKGTIVANLRGQELFYNDNQRLFTLFTKGDSKKHLLPLSFNEVPCCRRFLSFMGVHPLTTKVERELNASLPEPLPDEEWESTIRVWMWALVMVVRQQHKQEFERNKPLYQSLPEGIKAFSVPSLPLHYRLQLQDRVIGEAGPEDSSIFAKGQCMYLARSRKPSPFEIADELLRFIPLEIRAPLLSTLVCVIRSGCSFEDVKAELEGHGIPWPETERSHSITASAPPTSPQKQTQTPGYSTPPRSPSLAKPPRSSPGQKTITGQPLPASSPEGYVYVIGNKAWPDCRKVGMTIDYNQRLGTYQTYSPLRDYRLCMVWKVDDRVAAESTIKNMCCRKFRLCHKDGEEWFSLNGLPEAVLIAEIDKLEFRKEVVNRLNIQREKAAPLGLLVEQVKELSSGNNGGEKEKEKSDD